MIAGGAHATKHSYSHTCYSHLHVCQRRHEVHGSDGCRRVADDLPAGHPGSLPHQWLQSLRGGGGGRRRGGGLRLPPSTCRMPTAPPLPPPHLQDTRDGRMHCRMPAPPPTHTHTRVYKVHLRDARQHRCRTPAYHAPSPLPTRPLPPTCIMRDSTNAGCPRTTSSPKLTMYFGSMPHVAPKRVAYGCTCIHGDKHMVGGGGQEAW